VTRVVLVDDHPLFVEALRVAVERAGIEVAGTASRGDELMDLMESVEADAVLLDLAMPGLDGYECLAQLRERHPKVSGAVCFVGKATDPNDLAGAVHVLLSDSIHLEVPRGARPGPKTTDTNGAGAGLLTPRELEILRLASDGLSNSEMAKQLWVTDQTIKFHLSNIYRKLEVSNRTGASRWAREHGLLDEPDRSSRISH